MGHVCEPWEWGLVGTGSGGPECQWHQGNLTGCLSLCLWGLVGFQGTQGNDTGGGVWGPGVSCPGLVI